MIPLMQWLRMPLTLATGCLLSLAALAQEAALPPRPATHIYDDARVFSPEQTQKLETMAAESLSRTGASVDIATFTYISGGNTNQHAQRLALAWLGQEPGLVLVFNRGASQPAIAVSPGLWSRYPADDVTLLALRASQAFSDGPPVPDERLVAAAETALAQMAVLEKNRVARLQIFTADDKMLAFIVAVTLVLFGLLAVVLSTRLRKTREKSTETFTFPDVHVGIRLAAPFGGGKGAEASGAGHSPGPTS